jgi:hypothetical protein
MKKYLSFPVCVFTVLMAFGCMSLLGLDTQSDHGKPEPQAAGIHWAKGQAPNHGAKPVKSPNLSWHGGNIMVSAETTAIFWGPSWGKDGTTAFAGDKIAGLDTFYTGIGGTPYAAGSSEYTDASHTVGNTINHHGHFIDTSTATGGGSTTAIQSEVCKVLKNNGITPLINGYYPVYVDVKRGNAGYCAWHSAGTCGSTPVQFAFFFNLDGDSGCDVRDTSDNGHSEGLAALANVSGHELSEARSDPRLNAWYDSSGEENADKCAWTFGPTVAFSNGSTWKIQGNWSNSAYNAGTGYPNASGQYGCIETATVK